jgi:hypothetical protein
VNVTVTPATIAVSISSNGPSTWCAASGGSVEYTVNVTGGTAPFSYLWSPSAFLSDTFSQIVTASPDAAGTYPYTVVVTDASGCQASKSRTITVKPLPHPVITGVNSEYCANVASVPLTASLPGGVWSGPGVVGNTFRPAQIGPGVYTIVYTLTSGGCTNDTFQIITVDSLPVVSISGNNPFYCSGDSATTFVGSPAGGTWSGPGINPLTGVFNPGAIALGNTLSTKTVTIRYHYTNASGCTDSTSVSVVIKIGLLLSL